MSALEAGAVEPADIAKWEEEMAAIEAALMEHMPSEFESLEDFMAMEILDGQDGIMSIADQPLNINEQESEVAMESAALPLVPSLMDIKLLCKDTKDVYVERIGKLQR